MTHRRWFQFSLRTLLIAIALAAGLAFAWAKCIEPYRLQRNAMAAITKLGGSYKAEDATGWVRYLDKNPQDIVVVDLADCDKPDDYLPHLLRLPRLRTLVVGGHAVGAEQVSALGRIRSLKGLVLDSTLATDGCVEELKNAFPAVVVYKSERRAIVALKKYLAQLPPKGFTTAPESFGEDVEPCYFDGPLVVVHLHEEAVTDAELSWLVHLRDVRAIYAMQTKVTGTFLADVKGGSSLERLHLDNTQVDDSALANLSRFPNLTWLTLRDTRITDGGIPWLEKLPSLTRLNVAKTAISPAGVQRLQAAFPRCLISH